MRRPHTHVCRAPVASLGHPHPLQVGSRLQSGGFGQDSGHFQNSKARCGLATRVRGEAASMAMTARRHMSAWPGSTFCGSHRQGGRRVKTSRGSDRHIPHKEQRGWDNGFRENFFQPRGVCKMWVPGGALRIPITLLMLWDRCSWLGRNPSLSSVLRKVNE